MPILDTNGVPINGALINVYAAGTTTPLSLFTDSTLSTGAANPIVATQGFVPLRFMATASYKLVVTTSALASVTGYDGDNIDPGVAAGAGALPIANGGTAGTTAAAARTNLAAASATDMATAQSDLSTLQTTTGQGSTGWTTIAKGTTAQGTAGTSGRIRGDTTLALPSYDNGSAVKKIAIEGKLDHTYARTGSGLWCLQRNRVLLTAAQTIAANIPADNTTPQISEGAQITNFNVSFTPLSASSVIRIHTMVSCVLPSGTGAIVALFLNSAASAVAVSYCHQNGATAPQIQVLLPYEHAPGTLSAQTYQVNAGSSANSLIINGSTTFGGGVLPSELVIEEWNTV